MDIIKIIGIGLITVFAIMIVKPVKPEISIVVGLCGGLILLSYTIDYITQILNTFTNIISKTGLDLNLLKMVLKIIGVGYLVEFSASLCYDSGNSSIADKIIFAGKVIILAMSLPIVTNIIEIIIGIIP